MTSNKMFGKFLATLIGGVVGLCIVAQAAQADPSQLDRLWVALRMDETIAVLQEEGQAFAYEAAPDLTGRPVDDTWRQQVSQIYDADRMKEIVRTGMAEVLDTKDLGEVVTYYESAPGARVVALELSARRAYLSPGVDEAAREAWNWGAKSGAHGALIRQIVSDGDLIERNVTGSLNSNFAFLAAFADAAPKGVFDRDDRAILAEVMSEEPQTRLDTTEWLYGYLSLSYAPLSVEELSALVKISASTQGVDLNAALFAGFDPMYLDISREIGRIAGLAQAQQEL